MEKDPWITIIKQTIYDHLKKIDFSNPDFNINILKEQLSEILGIKPAIKTKWNTIETINELKKSSGAKDYKTVKDKLEEIEIIFIDSKNKTNNFKFIF